MQSYLLDLWSDSIQTEIDRVNLGLISTVGNELKDWYGLTILKNIDMCPGNVYKTTKNIYFIYWAIVTKTNVQHVRCVRVYNFYCFQ